MWKYAFIIFNTYLFVPTMENFTFQSTLKLVRFLCFHSTIYKYMLTVNRSVSCWRSVHTRSVKRNGHKQRTSNHIRLEQPHDQGRVYSRTGVRQHWCKTAYSSLHISFLLPQLMSSSNSVKSRLVCHSWDWSWRL